MPALSKALSSRSPVIASALEQLTGGDPSTPHDVTPPYAPPPPATIASIAKTLGIPIASLRQWCLSKHAADNYPEHAELYHHARIIEADQALNAATDHAEVSQRAHQAKLARHDAERRLSRLWGPKQETTIKDERPPVDLTELARRIAYIQAQAAASLPRPTPKPARASHGKLPVVDAAIIPATPVPPTDSELV